MDEFDRRLTALAERETASVATPPVGEIVRRGRRRRRVRRATIGGVAIALAGGAIAVGLTVPTHDGTAPSEVVQQTAPATITPRPSSTPSTPSTPSSKTPTTPSSSATDASAVAWVNRPAAPPAAPTRPPAPSVKYRQCSSGHLRASAGNTHPTQSTLTSIDLTNIGKSPCSLDGYPTSVTGVDPQGNRHVLHARHAQNAWADTSWPANLRTGETATMVMFTSILCDAMQVTNAKGEPYVAVVVGLPGGGSIRTAADFNTGCGISVSTIGAPRGSAPVPYQGLTATINAPATAKAGTTLHYLVTLNNTGRSTVRLAPCPVYEQLLAIDTNSASQGTYRLNCDSVTSIAAGDSVTYAMQIRVPDKPGRAKFLWTIDTTAIVDFSPLTVTNG